MKKIQIILAVVLVLAALGFAVAKFLSPLPQGGGDAIATSTPEGAAAGAHCGGFIRNAPVCAAGLHCVLDPFRPDTGGVCVPDQEATGTNAVLPYDSGIRGSVLLGPVCPVEQNPPAPQCAERPYSTLVVVFRTSDPVHAIAFAQSNASGTWSVALPPGSYVLGAGESASPQCDHPNVTVTAGAYASATVRCDTGIR